jgi:hypothetical protein
MLVDRNQTKGRSKYIQTQVWLLALLFLLLALHIIVIIRSAAFAHMLFCAGLGGGRSLVSSAFSRVNLFIPAISPPRLLGLAAGAAAHGSTYT